MTRFVRRALMIAAIAVGCVAIPALADEVYPIVFPVDGPHSTDYDNFGDCRDGCARVHQGSDIMADKGTPVVAAADGIVVEVRGINPDGSPQEGDQWLIVDHDGWQTWYLHLNNDTPGTNDGLAVGIAPDIVEAFVRSEANDEEISHPVEAGQVIGWVGNSGAEWAGGHLHFEIRVGESKWESVAIDPYPSLIAADPLMENGWNGTFADDDDSVHEQDIETLYQAGITKGCNPPANTNYCPERLITRGEIAAFIRRTLELPSAEQDFFADDDGSIFNDDINAITAAGIGFGCSETEYCQDQPLLRDEMAELLIRSFADGDPERYANPDGIDFFIDDDGNRFESSINLLMAAGVTKGCNPPVNDNFCPDRPLIRAEMASFFVRALNP